MLNDLCPQLFKYLSEDVRVAKKLTGTLYFDTVTNRLDASTVLITIQCRHTVIALSYFTLNDTINGTVL